MLPLFRSFLLLVLKKGIFNNPETIIIKRCCNCYQQTTLKKQMHKRMKILKSISIAVAAIILGAGVLVAQGQQQPPQMPDLPTSDDVSDEELGQLVEVINEIEPIQLQLRDDITEVVEEEDMSLERFEQLMMATQNPQMADQVDASDEEMGKIQNMQPKLMELQGEAQEQMVAKIEEKGLTTDRYQAIIMGAQQDPELGSRVEELLGVEEEEG